MSQLNHVGTVAEKQDMEAKTDTILNTLQSKTPNEIRTWVNNNVNNVADVKTMLARLIILVSVLARRQQ